MSNKYVYIHRSQGYKVGLAEYIRDEFGIKYEKTEDEIWFDPNKMTINAPHPRWCLHEICHWLVASEEDKNKWNYGLSEYPKHYADLIERLASVLEMKLMRLAGVEIPISFRYCDASDYEKSVLEQGVGISAEIENEIINHLKTDIHYHTDLELPIAHVRKEGSNERVQDRSRTHQGQASRER